ncbi:hypothetical protein GCM10027277_01930 [Pseudoduganella ginsengisoli]|uniref:Uncharacterized protein n=1 Tax=Pseudoduganella ginsengisoli TaxID=1462440 RepID=A0A6L6Q8A3_9BURK|nr:hypothetical protein [Pseudoduganella ginsengisoli]MTW05825.1 hypothetical protein [Pseudoduganella ginsengisoli]
MADRASFKLRMLVAATLAAHVLYAAWLPAPGARAEPLPSAPTTDWLRIASLGEPEVAARVLMLQVQTLDDGRRWRDLDYTALAAWLDRALDLDPRGQAPLLAAADVYGAIHDPARVRIMLEWIARRFSEDPDRRWPWLAHAALLARHRLHDPELAQRYAQAIHDQATGPDVPPWARELAPLLAGASERDAVRAIAGGLLVSNQVHDTAQLRWLERRLQRAEH